MPSPADVNSKIAGAGRRRAATRGGRHSSCRWPVALGSLNVELKFRGGRGGDFKVDGGLKFRAGRAAVAATSILTLGGRHVDGRPRQG